MVEAEAIEQIRRMCNYELTAESQVRIMPDVHAGKGCTLGTTMTILDKACPNIVGVDIGCGMYTVRLKENLPDFAAIDEAPHFIPSGMQVWDRAQAPFDLAALRCERNLKYTRRIQRALGTLGGGNHFIKIDHVTDGTCYLVIHSGSPNLGKQVAEHYQQLAIDLHAGREDYASRREDIIRTYRAKGRHSEIQTALIQLKAAYDAKASNVPEDICWLYGQWLDDYLHDVEVCEHYARRNREIMADVLIHRTGLTVLESFHTLHNYIDTKKRILRKGAIAAHKGEKVLIPVNMRDGSILAVGKGNPAWNESAPHGAGRIMSRTKARATISMKDFRQAMTGIYTISVSESTLDEAHMAYESLADIMGVIGDTVDVLDVMKPVYNFKASEADGCWRR